MTGMKEIPTWLRHARQFQPLTAIDPLHGARFEIGCDLWLDAFCLADDNGVHELERLIRQHRSVNPAQHCCDAPVAVQDGYLIRPIDSRSEGGQTDQVRLTEGERPDILVNDLALPVVWR